VSTAEKLQWAALVGLWVGSTVYYFLLLKEIGEVRAKANAMEAAYKAAIKIILVETERKKYQTEAFKRLSNPETIANEMENGARAREMYDANRTVLPREDAGPPAKIYTPFLRAKTPRFQKKIT
jgi:hypothetical protein